MKNISAFLFLIFLGIFNVSSKDTSGDDKMEAPIVLELPSIPENLKQPSLRADFLTLHFWDNVDFKSVRLSNDRGELEQFFVNFLSVLPHASSDSVISSGFASMLEKAQENPEIFRFMTGLAEQYLDGEDSPMKSEANYECFLSSLAENECIDEAARARIEDRIDMLNKNKRGTAAADFTFTSRSGETLSLKQTLPAGDGRLILIFFDPECENCDEALTLLAEDKEVADSIESGQLKILAVYSGEKKDFWKVKAASLPQSWTVGINPGEIDEEELYYLPSMPTVYILDNRGTVIDRNVKISEIL